jgi:hypothetical protein
MVFPVLFPVLIPDLFQFLFCIYIANHDGLDHIQDPCKKKKKIDLQEVKFDLMFTPQHLHLFGKAFKFLWQSYYVLFRPLGAFFFPDGSRSKSDPDENLIGRMRIRIHNYGNLNCDKFCGWIQNDQ